MKYVSAPPNRVPKAAKTPVAQPLPPHHYHLDIDRHNDVTPCNVCEKAAQNSFLYFPTLINSIV